jgi:hypothetical protein
MKKLFVIVRKDLTPSQQAVQAGHALASYLLHSLNLRWKNEILVYLGVKNGFHLEKIKYKFKQAGINFVEFNEPDLNNETTAIATDQENEIVNQLNLL